MTPLEALAQIESALLGRAMNSKAVGERVLAILTALADAARAQGEQAGWKRGAEAAKEAAVGFCDAEAKGCWRRSALYGQRKEIGDAARGDLLATAASRMEFCSSEIAALPPPAYQQPPAQAGEGE